MLQAIYCSFWSSGVETRQLAKRIMAEEFEIGNWKFIKCAYEVENGEKSEKEKNSLATVHRNGIYDADWSNLRCCDGFVP